MISNHICILCKGLFKSTACGKEKRLSSLAEAAPGRDWRSLPKDDY